MGCLVDHDWIEGGNSRTDWQREIMGMLEDSGHLEASYQSTLNLTWVYLLMEGMRSLTPVA